ncbi:hypothetical protein ERJ75_001734600 [Trypanosoma vivax]|uniref:Uncharacterized protein n=1 Tax=Trypanosoma vivax (strain Y486) TaxID=1055687 RepID=G0U338_TRYVY|nr:hypothetical protein TRVL_03589 [Trypanosoma vivax]KAH8604263.1 hypothetical protein ERJ75_001734600 [Trypanosoma vivax]CCC50693.1 conserved hypothetical protein [Trypanosoma vivax Y486]
MKPEKHIDSLEKFIRHVQFPLQPLQHETKVVLDAFFEKGGFLRLCDMAYGTYDGMHYGNFRKAQSWIDIGNLNPNGKVASSLFRLLAPGSHLCKLLESISYPQHDFSLKLKKNWKGVGENEQEFSTCTTKIDLPLSDLYASFHELLGEPAEANLYSLCRSKCPPMLLVPFWEPPLFTRLEASHRQVLTSLRCSPLSYFILRMLIYVVHRTEQGGADVVVAPRSGSPKRTKFSLHFLMAWVCGNRSIEIPFYHRLLVAYIQYFVSPNYVDRMHGKRTLDDVQWTVADVVSGLLLLVPSHLMMKYPKCDLELRREAIRDVGSAALVFRLIPFLTECFLSLFRKGNWKIYLDRWDNHVFFRKKFRMDCVALSEWDVLSPHASFYRNVMLALRQTIISLESFSNCRREHFNNSLELWYAVINPTGNCDEIPDTYVLHHFEAYSFLLTDVLNMVLNSSFLQYIDLTGARMWAKCIEVFTSESIQNIFSEISSSDICSRDGILDTIIKYFTLNWDLEDGSTRIMKPYAEETVSLVVRVYIATESRAQNGDLSADVVDALLDSLGFLKRSFKGLITKAQKYCEAHPSNLASGNIAPDLSHDAEINMNTEEAKDLFFRGIQRSCGLSGPLGLRFPTRSALFAGSCNYLAETNYSDEFPYLVRFTRVADLFIEKVLEVYYSQWIPTCDRGHRLWLLSSNRYTCTSHPEHQAIWVCSECDEVFGNCCRCDPFSSDGSQLALVEEEVPPSSYCSRCLAVFMSDAVVYKSLHTGSVLCSDCASRPFVKKSCRFLAFYITWSCVILSLILTSIIYRF